LKGAAVIINHLRAHHTHIAFKALANAHLVRIDERLGAVLGAGVILWVDTEASEATA